MSDSDQMPKRAQEAGPTMLAETNSQLISRAQHGLRSRPSGGRLLWLTVLFTTFNIPFEAASSLPVIGSIPRLIGGLAIIVYLANLCVHRTSYSMPVFGRLLLLHVTWVGLGLAWATSESAAKIRFGLLVQLALFAVLVVQVARTRHERAMLAAAYGMGSVVGATVVFYNVLHRITYLDQELAADTAVSARNVGHVARYTIGIEDPNYVALSLVVGIPLLLWGMSVLRGRWGVWLAAPFVGLILYSALLTGSRGSSVVAPVLAASYLIVSRAHRNFARISGLLLIAGLIGVFLWGQLPSDTQYRAKTGFDSNQSTSKLREDAWRAGYHAFLRRPFQGYGIGSYQYVVREELGKERVAHNTFISETVELGLLGVSLLVTALAVIWRRSRALVDVDRLMVRSTLFLYAGGAMFLNSELKKATFFLLSLLAAHVMNGDSDEPRGLQNPDFGGVHTHLPLSAN